MILDRNFEYFIKYANNMARKTIRGNLHRHLHTLGQHTKSIKLWTFNFTLSIVKIWIFLSFFALQIFLHTNCTTWALLCGSVSRYHSRQKSRLARPLKHVHSRDDALDVVSFALRNYVYFVLQDSHIITSHFYCPLEKPKVKWLELETKNVWSPWCLWTDPKIV